MVYQLDLYDAAIRRLKIIFDYFDYVYVSFSGGKDSGVLLNLCIDYIRKYALDRRLGVFHMDYEVQYRQTTEYVLRTLESNRDILDISLLRAVQGHYLHIDASAILASLG